MDYHIFFNFTKFKSDEIFTTILLHLAMNGESVYTIKAISNHKSMEMLDRYVKLSPNLGKNPIQNLWKKKSIKSSK